MWWFPIRWWLGCGSAAKGHIPPKWDKTSNPVVGGCGSVADATQHQGGLRLPIQWWMGGKFVSFCLWVSFCPASAPHPPLNWESPHLWGVYCIVYTVYHVHGGQRPISLQYKTNILPPLCIKLGEPQCLAPVGPACTPGSCVGHGLLTKLIFSTKMPCSGALWFIIVVGWKICMHGNSQVPLYAYPLYTQIPL